MGKLSLLVFLLTILSLLVAGASAYSGIYVSDNAIPPGSTGYVPVYIYGVEGAEGLGFNLTFDQTLLRFDGVIASDDFPGSVVNYGIDNDTGILSVSVTNPGGLTASESKCVVSLMFTAIAESGSSAIEFGGLASYSKNFEPVDFDYVGNGVVSIRDKRTIIAPSGVISYGQGAYLPVKVANITDAKYIYVDLIYDGDYVSIEDIVPASGVILSYAGAINGKGYEIYSSASENLDVSEVPEDLIVRAESYGYNYAWMELTVTNELDGEEQSVADILFKPTEKAGTANITLGYCHYRDTIDYYSVSAEEYFYFDESVPGQIVTSGGGITPGGDVKATSGDLAIGSSGIFPVQIKGFTGSDVYYFTTQWDYLDLTIQSIDLSETAKSSGVTIDWKYNGSYPGEPAYCNVGIGNLSGFNSDTWSSLLDFTFSANRTTEVETWFNISYAESGIIRGDNVTIYNPAKSVENGVITIGATKKPDLVGFFIDPPEYIKKYKNGTVYYLQSFVIENIGKSSVSNDFKINLTLGGRAEELDITQNIDPGSNITIYVDSTNDPSYPGAVEIRKIVGGYEIWLNIYSPGYFSLSEYKCSVGIDINNDIDEADENNNFIETTARVTYPDLIPIVYSELIPGVNPDESTADGVTIALETYKLTYGAKNIGNVSTVPTKLAFTYNESLNLIDVPALTPGESHIVSIDLNLDAISQDYKVEVNYDRSEAETDYSNNVCQKENTSILYFSPDSLNLAPGETSKMNLILNSVPKGLSGFNISLSVEDETLAEISEVNLPDWATLGNITGVPGSYVTISGVDLSSGVESGAENISFGEITVKGLKSGSTNVTVHVVQIDDDNGDLVHPDVKDAVITVNSLKPFPGMTNPPTDPDGDGIYEDINGNGRIDFDDVVKYYQNMEWISANQDVSLFDFNGNGRIDFDDVVKLYQKI